MDEEASELVQVEKEQSGSRELTPFSADLAEMDPVVALQRVERRIDFVKNAKLLALKITDSGDWIDQRGKPYLQASGCRKLKPVFRICYRDWTVEPTLDQAKKAMRSNEPVSFLVKGTARCDATGEESLFIGGRSADDDFFTIKYGEGGAKAKKEMSEIDVLDVMKSAVSNWEHRCICGLLGLDNLNWEDLKQHGIQPGGGRIDYKQRSGGRSQDQSQQGRQVPRRQPSSSEKQAESQVQTKSGLSVEEMRHAVREKLQREEKDPDKALEALTRSKLKQLDDLKRATAEQVCWLFNKLFPVAGGEAADGA